MLRAMQNARRQADGREWRPSLRRDGRVAFDDRAFSGVEFSGLESTPSGITDLADVVRRGELRSEIHSSVSCGMEAGLFYGTRL